MEAQQRRTSDTVKPCGHAFRVTDGQTIAEVREPAA